MLCLADGHERSSEAVDMASSFDSASMAELARKHWGSILPLAGLGFYLCVFYGTKMDQNGMMWHSPLEDRSINYQEHMVYRMQSNRTKLYIKNHCVLILLRSLLVYAVSENFYSDVWKRVFSLATQQSPCQAAKEFAQILGDLGIDAEHAASGSEAKIERASKKVSLGCRGKITFLFFSWFHPDSGK